ncbi:hypothetical protein [Ideonella dechloratans]|uniref:hypothetical protein n=1 Tax=Ideonella dechloratans TaxID=36863 RepID=UPI0035AD7A01
MSKPPLDSLCIMGDFHVTPCDPGVELSVGRLATCCYVPFLGTRCNPMKNTFSLILIAVVTLNTVLSHALLKSALKSISFPQRLGDWSTFLGQCLVSPLVWGSLTLQVFGYVCWMAVLSREKLAVAVALSGAAFYGITSLVGWLVFGERLGYPQVFGVFLISLGVLLLAKT